MAVSPQPSFRATPCVCSPWRYTPALRTVSEPRHASTLTCGAIGGEEVRSCHHNTKRGFPAAARLFCGRRVALLCAPPRGRKQMHDALIRAGKRLCQSVKRQAAPPPTDGRTFYPQPCAMLLNFAAHTTAPALCTNERWYAPRRNRRPVPQRVLEFSGGHVT